MKTTIAVVLVIAVFLMSSCSPETGLLDGNLTVSGTSSLEGNIKIGLFGPEANFGPGFANNVDAGNGGTFVPLVVVTPDGNGNYSIDFPSDPTNVAYLVAWIDYLNDDVFETPEDEQGYFPIKTVDSVDYVISGWQSVADIVQVLASDGENSFSFESIGTGGFDFSNPLQALD